MSSKPSSERLEDNFRDRMFIPAIKPFFDVTRVESPLVSAGVPDLNVCGQGIHEWIELKAMQVGETKISIRPTQYAWFRDRIRAGGNPMLVVWIDHMQGCLFVPGEHIEKLDMKKALADHLIVQHKSLWQHMIISLARGDCAGW